MIDFVSTLIHFPIVARDLAGIRWIGNSKPHDLAEANGRTIFPNILI